MKEDKDLFSKIFAYIIIFGSLILIIYGIILTLYKNYEFKKNSKYTVGEVIKVNFSRGMSYNYKFQIDSNLIEGQSTCKIRLKIGDKILVKYSPEKTWISDIMWNYTVPDALTVMPKNGWEEIPSFMKKE